MGFFTQKEIAIADLHQMKNFRKHSLSICCLRTDPSNFQTAHHQPDLQTADEKDHRNAIQKVAGAVMQGNWKL